MPEVRPFVGLQYDPAVVGPLESVTAPPYDVISPWDQERLHRTSEFNVIRLILGRDEPGDDPGMNRYTRGADYLRSWVDRGVLTETARPAVYPYEMEFHFGGRRRRTRGLIAEVGIEPLGTSVIPHERTIPGPLHDRLALLRAVRANLSPVYAVFPGPAGEVAAFLDRVTATPSSHELVDDDGTRHRLWVVDADLEEPLTAISRQRLMIADGHHRYSVALAFREEMRALAGPGPWDWMMMLIVDAAVEDPPVLPIHRVSAGLMPQLPTGGGERVRDLAEVLATVDDTDLTVGTVWRDADGDLMHAVQTLPGPPPTVCSLHDHVLDRHGSLRLSFTPRAAEAEAAVGADPERTAWLLPATTVERVWGAVSSGRKLPPKSTYFWPKPRTGLVIRPIEPDAAGS